MRLIILSLLFALTGAEPQFQVQDPSCGGLSTTPESSTSVALPTSSSASVSVPPLSSTPTSVPSAVTSATSLPTSGASSVSGTVTLPTPLSTALPAGCTPQTYNATGNGDTENGVLDKTCCTPLTVIFARGTGEPGNVGGICIPMFAALRSVLGNDVTIQGVDYAADEAGDEDLGAEGGPAMASLVNQSLAQCPNSKVVTSGYSQGGLVIHYAFSNEGLSASLVSAAVIFGDPENGLAVGNLPSSKVMEFCANGDDVCNGNGTFAITPAHLSYGSNGTEAAQFIVDVLGL